MSKETISDALVLTTRGTFLKGAVGIEENGLVSTLYIDKEVHPHIQPEEALGVKDIFIPYKVPTDL